MTNKKRDRESETKQSKHENDTKIALIVIRFS